MKKASIGVAAAALIVLLLLTTLGPASAQPSLSGVPRSIPLDKETTVIITIDLVEQEAIRIESIQMTIVNSADSQIASGRFSADGAVLVGGGFLVSAQLTQGSVVGDWGYGSQNQMKYAVTVLFGSTYFQESRDNGMIVTLFRGEGQSPMVSDMAVFDLGQEFPWVYVLVAVGIVAVIIVLGAVYYFRGKK